MITKYWSHKWNYPTGTPIDWPSLATTIVSLPIAQQWCISKHSSGRFGCGTKLLQSDHQDHNSSPMCNHMEDPTTCPHPESHKQLGTWLSPNCKMHFTPSTPTLSSSSHSSPHYMPGMTTHTTPNTPYQQTTNYWFEPMPPWTYFSQLARNTSTVSTHHPSQQSSR